jgi:threonine aldolase
VLPGFLELSIVDELRRVADWCAEHGIEHDQYGEADWLQAFERKVATVLGKAAAVFMPSGVMAQLSAVRLWTDAARVNRIGLHVTSHLLHHEQEAYAALLQCHAVPLGDRLRPIVAADLEAVPQPLACVIVELPMREVGGVLPTWPELDALKEAARARGVRLHMDGARLWESAAHYGKTYADIASGFDSVYVSVYKGIGAPAGALLAGDSAFIAEARVWRRRFGGTLHRLSPLAAAAAMRFDERLALMPALHARALELASGLAGLEGVRVQPSVPHTNMMHLHFDAEAEAVMQARDRIAASVRCWLIGGAVRSEVPGWSRSELYVGDGLLAADNATVLPLFRRLCEEMRSASP